MRPDSEKSVSLSFTTPKDEGIRLERSVVRKTDYEQAIRRFGIDINPDQRVLAEVDRLDNFIDGGQIPCGTYGKSRGQAKAVFGDATKQAITAAVPASKPIVNQRLGFADKKGH